MSFSNNFPATSPSLELDFANVGALDPRITFTRSSIATVTNSLGLLQTVQANVPRFDYDPVTLAAKGLLIEEQRTNLAVYSSEFDNAAWPRSGTTVTPNVAVSPDGNVTADQITMTSSAFIYCQNATVANATQTYTASIWVKGTPGDKFGMRIIDAATGNGGSVVITIATDAWVRYTHTQSIVVTTGQITFGLETRSGVVPGTGTAITCFAWGAQLEAGSFATSYIPSTQTFTGRTSTGTFIGSNGLIQTAGVGVARMQYNPTNLNAQPFLLLEAAATNLFTYSEEFSNIAWTKNNANVTSNVTAAPDGATTADKVFPSLSALDGNVFQTPAFAANTVYTESVYCKKAEWNWAILQTRSDATDTVSAWFNLDTGVVGSVEAGGTATITNVGGGWYRCSLTRTTNATPSSPRVRVFPTNANNVISTGDGTSGIFIWGAQLEAGSFATSYIPTVATTVPRSADTSTSAATQRNADVAIMTGTAFSSWYNPTEGTLFADYFQNSSTQSGGSLFVQSDGTNNNRILLTADGASSGTIQPGLYVTDLSAPQVAIVAGTGTIDSFNKLSAVYKLNDFAASFNGAAVVPDTGGTVPAVNRAYIGAGATGASAFINGTIRRITYYPIKLSSAQLQAITT